MKKLITAMLAAMASHAFAQEHNEQPRWSAFATAIEHNFSMPAAWVNIRDYIYLPGNAKLIVELTHAEQYNEVKYLDTMLAAFMRDIAFYKDSLSGHPGSVRIDYAPDEQLNVHKMRFKKHPTDGDIFMSKNGDKARLKIDQDTVRIYVKHNPVLPANNVAKMKNRDFEEMYNKAQFYQLTFCLNNYEDITRIAADKQTLQHAIDTMMSTKRKGTKNDPYKFPSSARYNPYSTRDDIKDKWWRALADVRFKQYNGLVKSEEPNSWKALNRSDRLVLDANVGVGLLRNTWAPFGEFSLSISQQSKRVYHGEYQRSSFGISGSYYNIFEREANGKYTSQPIWFANLVFSPGTESSFGASYLVYSQSNFFTGTTIKLFLNMHVLKKGLTLSPELILTDGFQQVFPALTLKVF